MGPVFCPLTKPTTERTGSSVESCSFVAVESSNTNYKHGESRRRLPKLHSCHFRRRNQVPRMDRRFMGHPVLPPSRLHTSVYHRAGACRDLEARVLQAWGQDDCPVM